MQTHSWTLDEINMAVWRADREARERRERATSSPSSCPGCGAPYASACGYCGRGQSHLPLETRQGRLNAALNFHGIYPDGMLVRATPRPSVWWSLFNFWRSF